MSEDYYTKYIDSHLHKKYYKTEKSFKLQSKASLNMMLTTMEMIFNEINAQKGYPPETFWFTLLPNEVYDDVVDMYLIVPLDDNTEQMISDLRNHLNNGA